MKSKRAKNLVVLTTKPYGDCALLLHQQSAFEAIKLAEQDAKERAVKAYCKSECDWDGHCHKRKECYMFRVFVDNLNNGGQDNE